MCVSLHTHVHSKLKHMHACTTLSGCGHLITKAFSEFFVALIRVRVHYVALVSLELSIQTKQIFACLYLPDASVPPPPGF